MRLSVFIMLIYLLIFYLSSLLHLSLKYRTWLGILCNIPSKKVANYKRGFHILDTLFP